MAPTRKIAPVVEDDTTSKMSDDTFDTSQRPKFSDITKVIDKLKTQRTNAREMVKNGHKKKLAVLKARIDKTHQTRSQALSKLKSDKFQRLSHALEKRLSCEEAIVQQINTLRKDRDHLALLIDAIYKARKEYATQLQASVHPA